MGENNNEYKRWPPNQPQWEGCSSAHSSLRISSEKKSRKSEGAYAQIFLEKWINPMQQVNGSIRGGPHFYIL